jgi:ABC-type amino acid transport substrate-binding protein
MTEEMKQVFPRPWSVEDSPWGHVYLKDATGKRIATVLGTSDRKWATACFIVDEINRLEEK